jgi:hypothetical protein
VHWATPAIDPYGGGSLAAEWVLRTLPRARTLHQGAHLDEGRSDRPPGAPFTFHETRITAWERCNAREPPRLSLNRRGGSRHPRAASSASGVTERRPRRFCHWYCDVMAKPMLTFLAGPRRLLAETPQARVLYPKAQNGSCERFRVSLRSSRHRRCRPAATFPEFPATIDPLSAFPPQVVRGPWERSSDPDTRHLSSSRRGLEARGDAPEPDTHSVRDRGPWFARFSAKSGVRRPARSAFHRVSSRMRLEQQRQMGALKESTRDAGMPFVPW